MEAGLIAAFVVFVCLAAFAIYMLWTKLRESRATSARYQPIADLQKEADRVAKERDQAKANLVEILGQLAIAKAEMVQVLDAGQLQEVGLYRKSFDFKDAAEYRAKLDLLRDQQEAMVKAGVAAVCASNWSINNSAAEGKKVTTKILKLMLRAFNGECDSLIGRVKHDNLASFIDRIDKAYASINKLGAGFSCSIATEYHGLKIKELMMVREYQQQVQEEREEQRQIREEMREEERRAAELEKLRKEADDDERRYSTLLGRAQEEAKNAEGARRQRLLDHIAELEGKLVEAHAKAERAKSQAQLTKAGHVYVLSNIGSFGDRVFKVGMTRRLDPQERVVELGDASVPFAFDVHAMIYTEDAPKLERALHTIFHDRRVNRVNLRKEFFQATIDEIEESVRKHHGEFRLTKMAEAIEYRRTLGLLEEAKAQLQAAPPAVPMQAVGGGS